METNNCGFIRVGDMVVNPQTVQWIKIANDDATKVNIKFLGHRGLEEYKSAKFGSTEKLLAFMNYFTPCDL